MICSISAIPESDRLGHLLGDAAAAEVAGGQQPGGHLDPAERVADLVGDAGRHLAEGGQLLPLDQPLLGGHLLGEIAQDAHRSQDPALGVEDTGDAPGGRGSAGDSG